MTLPFQPMTLTFTDMHYFVKCPPVSRGPCGAHAVARMAGHGSSQRPLLCREVEPLHLAS